MCIVPDKYKINREGQVLSLTRNSIMKIRKDGFINIKVKPPFATAIKADKLLQFTFPDLRDPNQCKYIRNYEHRYSIYIDGTVLD